ncbi:MAG: cytochrome b/b6 domain-containing protein [SAR324 cluster bacterium]|nr:cytochrome b/b6 domain-containing protein [SAR324 cluster bacterium]
MKIVEAKIWPAVIRLFHLGLTGLIIGLFVTSFRDGQLRLHIYLGYSLLIVVLWRIFYGFYGSYYAQFRNFLVSPNKMIEHLRLIFLHKPPLYPGHPPPAGWMTVIMLLLLGILCLSGIGVFLGEERYLILGYSISNDAGEQFHLIHQWSSWSLVGLIVLHIIGVMLDSWHHHMNLPKSMVTGYKNIPADLIISEPLLLNRGIRKIPGLLFLMMAGAVLMLMNHTMSSPQASPGLEKAGAEVWARECGSCHQLFHPSLLPERSWRRMMGQLDQHFGDNASLDPDTEKLITDFMSSYAADGSTLEVSYKIRKSLDHNEVPLAITETLFWRIKHEKLHPDLYRHPEIASKANCLACHADALNGRYDDHQIKMPVSEFF